MSVAPHSGIVDFGVFTPPTIFLDGIQGEAPAPLISEIGYVLSTNGWVHAGGVVSVTNIIADYTVQATDMYITASNTITIFLPDASTVERPLTIKNIGVGVLTIDPFGTQNIDGYSTLTVTETNSSVDLISNGFNWFIT